MLSALQVRNHRFAAISLKPVTDLEETDLAQRSITCRHQLTLSHKTDDTRFWLVRLRIELIHPEGGPRSIYTGDIEIVGEFEFHPDVPETDRQKMVAMNSGAILYSAVRECVCTLSSRSLHGMVELPTIDARGFLPQEEPPLATKAKSIRK